MSNLVIIDHCGFNMEEEPTIESGTERKKRSYLDFSLKQIQDFLAEAPRSIPTVDNGLLRRTKIVRILASLFTLNYKIFVFAPILPHAPMAFNKYFLDIIEGLSNKSQIIEIPVPTPKKDAKFIYFSIFCMYFY